MTTYNPVLLALLGTGFTFLATAAGAGMVFFFRKQAGEEFQRSFLGFAAGVMIAASVWSLLIPAIEMAEGGPLPGWVPAAGAMCIRDRPMADGVAALPFDGVSQGVSKV